MESNFQPTEKNKTSSELHNIWHFFEYNKINQSAKCKKCMKVLKCYGRSTSSLHSHLKTAHSINALKRTTTGKNCLEVESSFCSQSSSLTNFFRNKTDDSLAAIISRMTAKDGIPLSMFCTSSDLRKLLIAKGFQNVPKSPNTIRRLIVSYSKKIRDEVVNEISHYKERGGRFSLSFDEWTSSRNRRYLNINAHSNCVGQFWNLGLARVVGSLPAEKCVDLLLEKLCVFNISMEKDVVCITTDGAAVMKKVGRLIPVSQQLCFAHAIQLAVLGVLYRNNSFDVAEVEDLPENEEDSTDEDSDDKNSNNLNYNFDVVIGNKVIPISNHRLMPLIAKVRKVIRIFRLSPTRNDDILQKYVKAEFGKEIMLILDSKTRWNSLLTMLDRFLKLKSAIQKALIDIKSSYLFSVDEFNLLSETVATLTPIKFALEALCRRDANLLTAEATLKFLLSTLEKMNYSLAIKMNYSLAIEMKDALELRIKERRTDLSGLLQYLHSGYANTSSSTTDIFPALKKSIVKKLLLDMVQRLFKSDNEPDVLEQQRSEEDVGMEVSIVEETENEADTIKQQMQRAIDKHLAVPEKRTTFSSTSSIIEKTLKRELAQFEDDGHRGKWLDLCYNTLKSIPPTSVESERAFSVSGNFCTKLRSRLSDKTIDDLCSLRGHFNKI